MEFGPEVSFDLFNADKRALEFEKHKVDTTSQYTRACDDVQPPVIIRKVYNIHLYKYKPHSHVDIDHRTKVVLNDPTTKTTARPSGSEYYDYGDYYEVSRIIEFA